MTRGRRPAWLWGLAGIWIFAAVVVLLAVAAAVAVLISGNLG